MESIQSSRTKFLRAQAGSTSLSTISRSRVVSEPPMVDADHHRVLLRDLRSYLEQASPTFRSVGEEDLSQIDDIKFADLANRVHEELVQRNQSTGVTSGSLTGVFLIRKASKSHFNHLSPEKFFALARGVSSELARRNSVPASPSTVTLATPSPRYPTRGLGVFRERAESAIPFNPPTHRVPRSSTASDIVHTRRSSPLDRRIPFASSPLKHSNSPYRSRTQNQAPSHLWRSSPHRPLACLPSDSEVSNEFGADSDDYFADDGRSSTESTIQRLRKALEEKENIVQEQDQTIRDLRNKFLGAEAKILDLKDELQRTRNTAQDLGRALDRRSEAQTSLEDYSDMLKKDNIKLGNLVNSLRQENYELVRKAYTYSVPSTPWHWLDIDPYMKLFLQDACHSDFYKELLLATRGDLAKKILDALHTVLSQQNIVPKSSTGLDYRNILRRFLVRLSRESEMLPERFWVEDIYCKNRDPMSGGSFADIFEANLREEKVALKRLRYFSHKMAHTQDLLREAIVWNQLEHPHILPFYGVDRQSFTSHLCMVSPWMSHGNVYNAIETLRTRGELIPYMPWIIQIAKGLKYLHEENVVHGDVRCANVMIDDNIQVRVGDFGLAFFADAGTASMGSHSGGAARWMAPELLKSIISRPNQASDTYAFGCTCVEIYSGCRPFDDIILDAQVVYQVQQGARPARPTTDKGMPDGLWDLVQRCWADDPSQRPTMSDIVSELERSL